jgi:hypothetical protein
VGEGSVKTGRFMPVHRSAAESLDGFLGHPALEKKKWWRSTDGKRLVVKAGKKSTHLTQHFRLV